MRGRKYPLEPLEKLRQERVDGATRALADAVKDKTKAEARRARVEEERRRGEDEARRTRDHERDALERGDLSAADLMRAAAWEVRARAEAEEHARRVAGAEAADAAAQASLETARFDLAQRKSDADVMAKDRRKWRDRVKKDEEKAEEAAAEEAWRPKGGG
jgi:hypothetical protein